MEIGPSGPGGIMLELEMWLYEIQDYLMQLADLGLPMVPFLPWKVEVFRQPEPERVVLQEGIRASCMATAAAA